MMWTAEKLAQLEPSEAAAQVERAILQQRLGMCGNVLLVAWLLALVVRSSGLRCAGGSRVAPVSEWICPCCGSAGVPGTP